MDHIIVPKHPELAMSYGRIADFFDAWPLPCARNYLKKIIKTAFSEKAGRMPVSSVFYFFEHLEHLTSAAVFIAPHYDKSRAAILDPKTIIDLNRSEHYCGWSDKYNPWHYFPRFLTEKEYRNPYKVFRKIAETSMEEWKKLYKDLLEYCYLNDSFSQSVRHPQTISLYTTLSKLIEAAHLVEVRSIVSPRRSLQKLEESLSQTKEQGN